MAVHLPQDPTLLPGSHKAPRPLLYCTLRQPYTHTAPDHSPSRGTRTLTQQLEMPTQRHLHSQPRHRHRNREGQNRRNRPPRSATPALTHASSHPPTHPLTHPPTRQQHHLTSPLRGGGEYTRGGSPDCPSPLPLFSPSVRCSHSSPFSGDSMTLQRAGTA